MRNQPTFLLLISVLVITGCATRQTPPDLSAVKAELYAYHDNGQYGRDVARFYAQATEYVLAAYKDVKKPAIVMDIDETSLSNWEELKANDLTFKLEGPCNHLPKGPCGLDAFHQKSRAAGILPAVALFNAAREKDIAIFFITGRREFLRAATVKNLHAAGYEGWQGLILCPNNSSGPAANYKAPERAKIKAAGYTIIATIGDQQSDLDGGHTGKAMRVPNPYYNLP